MDSCGIFPLSLYVSVSRSLAWCGNCLTFAMMRTRNGHGCEGECSERRRGERLRQGSLRVSSVSLRGATWRCCLLHECSIFTTTGVHVPGVPWSCYLLHRLSRLFVERMVRPWLHLDFIWLRSRFAARYKNALDTVHNYSREVWCS